MSSLAGSGQTQPSMWRCPHICMLEGYRPQDG